MTPAAWNPISPAMVGLLFTDELIHHEQVEDRDGYEKLDLWYTTQQHLYKRVEVNGRITWYRWMPGPKHK